MSLTIILTLKDRSPFTYRWMRYMNDMRCPYKILIADGGKDEVIEEHLRHPENYPHLDYDYIRYTYDATLGDFLKKLENIVSKVRTRYLLQADNDDFFLLDRIPTLLAHLDSHSDCSGARGQVVNFEVFDSNGCSKGVTSGRSYQAVTNQAPSLDMESDFERVELLCKQMSKYDYYANWYCVFRTAELQELWKNMLSISIREMIVFEILTLVLMAKKGKIHILPEAFYLRQNNTSEFGDTLVVGNEFLERCVIDNSLAQFPIAMDRLLPDDSRSDKDRMLRAIAAWLEIFVSNIHQGRLRSGTAGARLRRSVKAMPYIGAAARVWYVNSAHLLSPIRHRKVMRFGNIEPYIIAAQKGPAS
jgi:glycosyltransferase domain-containing protein